MTIKRRFNKKPKLLKRGGSVDNVRSFSEGSNIDLLNKYGFNPVSPVLRPVNSLAQRYSDSFNKAKQVGSDVFFVDGQMHKVYTDTPPVNDPPVSTNFDNLDFNSAFGKARDSNMKTFSWRGKEYGTQLKGENTGGGSESNNKGDFNKAFASARKDGYDTFEWNGKIYGTRLRGESPLNKPKDQIKHRNYEEYTTSLDNPKVEEKIPVDDLVVTTKRFTPDIKEQDKVYTPTKITANGVLDYLSGLYETYASPIDNKIQKGVDYVTKDLWKDLYKIITSDNDRVHNDEGTYIGTKSFSIHRK